MDGYRELHLLVHALRSRVIDPGRLADAVGNWDDHSNHGLMTFLAERGIISPDDLHRLESMATEGSATISPGDAALDVTREPAGIADATIDLPASGVSTIPIESGDRYKVIRLHQSGGLGRVWLARDKAIGRNVALKTIRTDKASSPNTRARFVRECARDRPTRAPKHRPPLRPIWRFA